MEVIVEVIIEMGSILIMGTICFALYLNGKLFLIKIGLIGVTANALFELDIVSANRCATMRANPISWVTQLIVISLSARSIIKSSTGLAAH